MKKRTVIMAGRDELMQPVFYRRLHMTISAFPYSRRRWLDELERVIYSFDGRIVDQRGRLVPVPNISTAFDDSNRWFSNYIRVDADGQPKSRCIRSLLKLQCLQLFLAIARPDLERHLWR